MLRVVNAHHRVAKVLDLAAASDEGAWLPEEEAEARVSDPVPEGEVVAAIAVVAGCLILSDSTAQIVGKLPGGKCLVS